jgi:hypothetical protein
MPTVKILFTPKISAILPKGIRNMEAARKKAAPSQLMATASMENSMPIDGTATISEETMKGARNDPPADINATYFLSDVDAIIVLNIWTPHQ